jgi:hypothetical protein
MLQPTTFLTPKAAPYGLGSLSREQIQRHRQIKPALRCWQVGNVAGPFQVGFARVERSLELVLSNRVRVLAVRCFLLDSTFAFSFKPLFTHDAGHHGFAARFVFFEEAGVNSSSTIGVAAVLVDGFDFIFQVPPCLCSFGFWPSMPFVKPAFTDLEHSHHDLEVEFFAVLVNEFESHLLSLAKKRPSPKVLPYGQDTSRLFLGCHVPDVQFRVPCGGVGFLVPARTGQERPCQ